jgi:hypothetical protein
MNLRPNIVLVHGAFADGSSWGGVIERRQADGYFAAAPQFPTTALACITAFGLDQGESSRPPDPCRLRARPAHQLTA